MLTANELRDVPRLIVPFPDEKPWPTLGPGVCDFIEDQLVHGPGDVLGDDITLTEELQRFIYRMYEVYPRNHPHAGRRRFKRETLSRRKGWSKTEFAAWIAICEMDPEGPVRFDGWRKVDGVWVPVGRPVRDPYIPMVATTEDQTEDLAYGAVYAILTNDRCPLVNDYDVGYERIMHASAPGKIRPLASAPSAREGARTSFEHFDEPHLFIEARLKRTHSTMLRNLPKRKAADAHALETTTMYEPGADSVAEDTHKYAIKVATGEIQDPRLLFDHLQASRDWNIADPDELQEALREASGDTWPWSDALSMGAQFTDPTVHEADARRYWLNQAGSSKVQWLPPGTWEPRARPDVASPAARTPIVVGFRGAYANNQAALIGCTVERHLFTIRVWEREEVSHTEVDTEVRRVMDTWRVKRFAFDPLGWHEEGEGWVDAYGDEVAVRFETRKTVQWAEACGKFYKGSTEGELTHDGNAQLAHHLADARPKDSVGGTYIVARDDVPTAAGFAAVIAFSQVGVLRQVPTSGFFGVTVG